MSNMMTASSPFDTSAISKQIAQELTKNTEAFKRTGPVYLKLPTAQRPSWTDSEGENVPAGTKLAINPLAIERGFVAWFGGKPVAESMANILDAEPMPPSEDANGNALPEKADVVPQYVVRGAFEDGSEVIIRGGSKGFIKAIQKIGTEVKKRAVEGQGKLCPVVTLGLDSYVHPGDPARGYSGGKIVFPVFNIVGWA
jgi:hypothetical protein